jgi:pyridoxine kinase
MTVSRQLTILSIQSHVSYGHVGNASAVFPMQRMGVEVWPVNTVQFSNHPGHGSFKGRVFDGQMIDEIIEGMANLGVLGNCDGVLSGYVGSSDLGHAIVHAVDRVRAANPRAVFCCDPVMGDVGRGIYVRPGVPDFMRSEAVPRADIITPNQFELEFLAGETIATMNDTRKALGAVHAQGPRVIMVTSLVTDETPADSLDLVASDQSGVWRVRSPRLDLAINGAGDAIAAVFFTHWLRTKTTPQALQQAASSIYGVLKATAAAGSREILTVAAQEEFVKPTALLPIEQL